MRTGYSNRGKSLGHALIAGAVFLAFVVSTVGFAWYKSWLLAKALAPLVQPEGTIAVPITTQAVPAYTRLNRDHFWDAKARTIAVIYLYPNEIVPGTSTSLDQILNRVLAVDKKPGYAVTELDLLPKGTRAGIAGGVPPGKRAIVLGASLIHGIHGLRRGDHLDLVASIAVDPKPPSGGRDARSILLAFQPPTSALGTAATKKKANVIVLAEDAVLVSPVTIRYLPSPTAPKGKGTESKGKPIEEVVIAVDPDEVTRVSEGLGVDAVVTAIAHSGRPDPPKTTIKPAPPPPGPSPTVIETIRGGKRTTLIFTPDGMRVGELPGSPDIMSIDTTAQR